MNRLKNEQTETFSFEIFSAKLISINYLFIILNLSHSTLFLLHFVVA